MTSDVVVFELNEVPWLIVDDFIAQHPESTVASLLAQSRCYTTVAADKGHLSPWTTWPSLHRGVDDEHHMIASFGQLHRRADRKYPPIWTILRNHGVSVGLCGTLHTFPAPADLTSYAFYLPDVFASEPIAHPPDLVDFQRFNLSMSRQSARNVDRGIAKKDLFKALRHPRSLGIRPQTYAALAKQLVAERRNPSLSNRRRTYQSVLLYDIFDKQLRQTQPRFSSFFTNHVASAMHRYWAAHRPDDYAEIALDDEWIRSFAAEVMWAFEQSDAMLARLKDYADSKGDVQIWIASSMGQGPVRAEALETQLYLTHPDRFMEAMGLGHDDWERRPAMLPQFNLMVAPDHVEAFRDQLRRVRIADKPLQFKRRPHGFFSLEFGQPNLHGRADAVTLDGQAKAIESLGLETVEIEDRSGTTAYHVPEGVLAIYDPRHRAPELEGRPRVSVLEIAPTWLSNFGIEPPGYMVEPSTLYSSN